MLVDRHSTAMISQATVMSKPSSRGTPLGLAAQAVHDVAQLAVVHVHRSASR